MGYPRGHRSRAPPHRSKRCWRRQICQTCGDIGSLYGALSGRLEQINGTQRIDPDGLDGLLVGVINVRDRGQMKYLCSAFARF